MPLGHLFDDRLEEIRAFLEFPPLRVMSIRHDPDIKQILMRMLVGLEEDEDNPHLVVLVDVPFVGYEQYLVGLLQSLTTHVEERRPELVGAGLQLPDAPRIPSGDARPEPAALAVLVASYFSALAEALPDHAGSLGLLIDPIEIRDEVAFARTMEALAACTTSDWAKFLVLDRRRDPMLVNLEARTDLAAILSFYVEPSEIEAEVKADLAGGRLTREEQRRYTMMVGAFAASSHRLQEAESSLLDAHRLAQEDAAAGDRAHVLYNLGNVYQEQARFDDAADVYTEAAKICLAERINPLLAMVLTNLGVALQRLQRAAEALESFDVARRTFRALNHRPGEAHVLDCRAHTLALMGRPAAAEQTWLEALALYDGITASHLAEVRKAGRDDILAKLTRFQETLGQRDKPAPSSPETDARA